MSAKLYELTAAYQQLENMLDVEGVDEQEFFNAIDTIDGALKDKAINIVMFIENLSATAEAIKAAEGKMADRRRALENKVKRIKEYVLRSMVSASIQKIECEFFKIAVRDNPLSIVVDNQALIPAEYMRQPETPPPAPDKKKMLDDIKVGVVIDGVHAEQTKSLRIS